MQYQWDNKKAKSNLEKHRVEFADAIFIFADNFAITIEDDYPAEEWFITIGIDALGRVLVVVYSWRGEDIRIISDRKATPYESKRYDEGRTNEDRI